MLPTKQIIDIINSVPYETPRCFSECSNFGTQRVQFNRRKSHIEKQVLIIHFEGVIGNLILTSIAQTMTIEEVTRQLYLRYETQEGILELCKNFQVVLFSNLTESLTLDLV